MFCEITLHNFRTHAHSTIELGGVNLIIGNNNSGKTNLLSGIQHFSRLIAQSRLGRDATLRKHDFFPHRHRLAAKNEPMFLSCHWHPKLGEVIYRIAFNSKNEQRVACQERAQVRPHRSPTWQTFERGHDRTLYEITLQRDITTSTVDFETKALLRKFYRDIGSMFLFHFQPSYLKTLASSHENMEIQNRGTSDPRPLPILASLGHEGGNLQRLLLETKNREERTFASCIAFLRRFDPSFHGIRSGEDGSPIWEFELGASPAGRLDEFPPHVVSAGLLKAAAIALLVSLQVPPALVLMEELENGINPRNIQGLLEWLWNAAGLPDSTDRGYNTQFIVTSHSPSVLREFSSSPENVHVVHLHRYGFKSDVRNLATVLETLYGIGTVTSEAEPEVRGRRKIIILKPYQLADLWYNGTIG